LAQGRFIAFEGGEGVGKSTQCRLLAEALHAAGHEVVLTREPGGTPGAEAVRALLLDADGSWGARAEALLFAAARADHVDKLIAPALARGAFVVCDRFLGSSLAYQGGGSGVSVEDITTLHTIGSQGLLPDLTVLVEAPADITAQRLMARDAGNADRIGGREAAYHERVGAAFAAQAQAAPQRFARINGLGSRQDVQARVLAAVAGHFGLAL